MQMPAPSLGVGGEGDRGAAAWRKDARSGNAPEDLKYQEEKLPPQKCPQCREKPKEAQRTDKGSGAVIPAIITTGMEDKFSIIPGDFNNN